VQEDNGPRQIPFPSRDASPLHLVKKGCLAKVRLGAEQLSTDSSRYT